MFMLFFKVQPLQLCKHTTDRFVAFQPSHHQIEIVSVGTKKAGNEHW